MGQISGERVWSDLFIILLGITCLLLFSALSANPIFCSLLLLHPILLGFLLGKYLPFLTPLDAV